MSVMVPWWNMAMGSLLDVNLAIQCHVLGIAQKTNVFSTSWTMATRSLVLPQAAYESRTGNDNDHCSELSQRPPIGHGSGEGSSSPHQRKRSPRMSGTCAPPALHYTTWPLVSSRSTLLKADQWTHDQIGHGHTSSKLSSAGTTRWMHLQ